MDTVYYPRLLRRLRAVMIDSVIVPVAMIGTLFAGVAMGITDPVLRWVLLIAPLFLLEPVLVAYTGGTLGHHLLRLRVMKQDGSGNLNIFAATLRFMVKVLTGWFAFVFVLTSRRHQGLHDMASRSIVVHQDAKAIATHEALLERQVEDSSFTYQPAWRRVLVILGYCLLFFVLVEIGTLILVSWPCIQHQHCGDRDRILLFALDILWLAGTSFSIVLGWTGRLFGARRRPRQ